MRGGSDLQQSQHRLIQLDQHQPQQSFVSSQEKLSERKSVDDDNNECEQR
jgi:chromosome condensin MukBEF MukE localization factor